MGKTWNSAFHYTQNNGDQDTFTCIDNRRIYKYVYYNATKSIDFFKVVRA